MFDSLRARWSAIAVRPQVSEAEQPYVTGVDALLSDEVSAQHSVQRLVEEIDRHLYLAKVTGSVSVRAQQLRIAHATHATLRKLIRRHPRLHSFHIARLETAFKQPDPWSFSVLRVTQPTR